MLVLGAHGRALNPDREVVRASFLEVSLEGRWELSRGRAFWARAGHLCWGRQPLPFLWERLLIYSNSGSLGHCHVPGVLSPVPHTGTWYCGWAKGSPHPLDHKSRWAQRESSPIWNI